MKSKPNYHFCHALHTDPDPASDLEIRVLLLCHRDSKRHQSSKCDTEHYITWPTLSTFKVNHSFLYPPPKHFTVVNDKHYVFLVGY